MDAQEAYISQIRMMTDEINAMFDDVPEDILHKRPGPGLNPIGWNYWHLLRIWDGWLNVRIGGRDASEDTWHRGNYAEKSGYNPDGKGAGGLGTGMGYSDAEVDEVQIPLSIIQEYQRQLQEETEAYLRQADEAELNRPIDSHLGRGATPYRDRAIHPQRLDALWRNALCQGDAWPPGCDLSGRVSSL